MTNNYNGNANSSGPALGNVGSYGSRVELLPEQVIFDPLEEQGSTGLRRAGGFVDEELSPELHGQRWQRAIREMIDTDYIVGACLLVIETLVRQVSWRFEVASKSPVDIERKDLVSDMLFNDMSLSWQDTLSEIFSFVPWGWAYLELCYKLREGDNADPRFRSNYDDGLYGWRKWSIRAQETLSYWEFDDRDSGIRGMWQTAPPSFALKYIPIEKALLFRTTSRKGNPEGKSVLRNIWRGYRNKRRIENLEGIGIERDLAGLPVAYVPPELLNKTASAAIQTLRQHMEKMITNIRRDEQEGVLFPLAYDSNGNQLYKLELLSTGGARQFDTNSIVQRYEQRMAMALLTDVILLGHESSGSWALSSDKTTLLSLALGSFLDIVCSVVNTHAIPRLYKLNSWDTNVTPKLLHGDIETIDLKALAEYITALANSGALIFPTADGQLERHLLNQAKLPTSGIAPEYLPE